MLKVAIIFIVGFATNTNLFAQDDASIEWGRPVMYTDFEATPNAKDTAAANISVTILLGYSAVRDGTLAFKVVAVMDKRESWIREAFKTEAVLRHEQGHFDIAHIFAKQLEKELSSRAYTTREVKTLNALYNTFLEKMNTLQLRYDKETKGGLEAGAQRRWQKYIEGEIMLVEENWR